MKKNVQVSNSVFYLNTDGGSNAFMFLRQDANSISNSYFAGKEGSEAVVLMTANKALSIKSNTWFNAAVGFHGPVSFTATNEWGYDF